MSFWLYDALGLNIWVHTDNERSPERPLVVVLDTASDEVQRRRRQVRMIDAATHRRPGELREVRIHGPSPPSLPPYTGPPIVHAPGPHLLELVLDVDGSSRPISDGLAIRS
jgi:hypothetical protein